MPWVCTLFLDREQQISSIEAEESLQWMSSSDVKLSLFWLRSLHNPSICRKLEMHMESDIWLNQHLGSWKEAFSLHINSKSVYHLLNMGVGCWLQNKMTGGLCLANLIHSKKRFSWDKAIKGNWLTHPTEIFKWFLFLWGSGQLLRRIHIPS